jgi:hypothetical protein
LELHLHEKRQNKKSQRICKSLPMEECVLMNTLAPTQKANDIILVTIKVLAKFGVKIV